MAKDSAVFTPEGFVAVSTTVTDLVPADAVPENCPVAALKVSQVGSAAPRGRVAV